MREREENWLTGPTCSKVREESTSKNTPEFAKFWNQESITQSIIQSVEGDIWDELFYFIYDKLII